jgi:hypothetical protein
MSYPVFIINGFLDAGKSTFIIDTLKNDGFYKQGTTLLLVCEEGEVEYDAKELGKYNVVIHTFSSVDEFNADVLYKLCEECNPGRIVIETNSMWDDTKMKFPQTFQVGQIVSFIDFTTFPVYFNNMRQKFVDNLRFSDLIVINNAQYIAMNSQGQVQEAFESPLPYNLDDDVIVIKDEDFARWYIDTFDHKERYENKVVEFNGIVLRSKKLPKNTIIVGRHVMTCCAKDVQLYGHLCKITDDLKIKSKSWINVQAKITYEYSKEYEEEEVVLEPIKITPIKQIDEPVLNLR